MSYAKQHLDEAARVIAGIDSESIEKMVALLADLRARGGRLFFLGVGGSAANCSHAVNDFRKIAGIEAYTPVDNVSELTARTNDEGWESVFVNWLKGSRLQPKDMLFVFSVGGGSLEQNISPNLVLALQYAQEVGARIVGVVGRDPQARVTDGRSLGFQEGQDGLGGEHVRAHLVQCNHRALADVLALGVERG